MPHFQSLPNEILLMILSYLTSYKDIVALCIQDRRLLSLYDLTTLRKYQQVRIRQDEHLGPAFDVLISILRDPKLGKYVRHLEVDRQPLSLEPYVETNWRRSLSESDLGKLEDAVQAAGDLGYSQNTILNMLMQTQTNIEPQEVKVVRGTFIGQAIAVLLISVCPELESLVLGAPHSVEETLNNYSYYEFMERGRNIPLPPPKFPMSELLSKVTQQSSNSPYLQRVRTTEFLPRPYLGKKWYSPCDFYNCVAKVSGLPKLEKNSIDGMRLLEAQPYAMPPPRTHIKVLEFHRSLLSSLFFPSLL
ncbi:hypothetical protein BDW74DRAFT_176587 [Aspergillus multicolor]|uniref:uncharacterized protein n=1 Tax=Aspergillus multicolor TaxID=41759 RepID=UPI003CCDF123